MKKQLNHKISKTLNQKNLEKSLQPYRTLVSLINQQHQELKSKSDDFLKHEYKTVLSQNELSTELKKIKFFAILKEVISRQLGIIPYDVQLLGGLALYDNKLIEMQTGEGKTLTALFPSILKAFDKQGVHILTFNDYLAKRDANWMKPVYDFFELSVGFVQEGMSLSEKKTAYNCDITYATAKEAGFDYLRSFIAYSNEEIIQRPFYFAIIDEADAILIDEARNPLVLAGNIIKPQVDFKKISSFVSKMEKNIDYDFDEYVNNIYLTETGIEKIEKGLGIHNLQADKNYELLSSINLAIHARELLVKDVDYVVKNNEIFLVDEFTGRVVKDRKWRNGLQTAVEAKEGLDLKSEGNILNMITLQHFISQYPEKAGMTATALQSAEEFYQFYGFDILVIPPNQKCIRQDVEDEIFTTKEAKFNALIKEVKKVHQTGQPILIGTLTVKESEKLAQIFEQNGLDIKVLNARNDKEEASIIAEAGSKYAITISTNMAGRGTDILLGGKDGSSKAEVECLGGLYVIGTNRHESQRIDNQLRGRAGRQGDIGKSKYYISFEDDLMEKYKLMEALPKSFRNLKGMQPIKIKAINKLIGHIQRVMEGQAYETRKSLFEYSDFVEKQRHIFQSGRQRILKDPDELKQRIIEISGLNISEQFDQNVWQNLKTAVLFTYDKLWAEHLDYLQQIKDSIHLVRIGGQNPIREFHRKADESFKKLIQLIENEVAELIYRFVKNPKLKLSDLNIEKPTSTWTYMINDNPFGNQLAIMLLDNSNLGFQADPFSALLLLAHGMTQRMKRGKV